MLGFSERKFRQKKERTQHKIAADLLRTAYSDQKTLTDYQQVESWLKLPPISCDFQSMSDRFHFHLHQSEIDVPEDQFLPNVRHYDHLTHEPFLNIDIYLDRLRSAYNVGSILRTTEAFRLGEIHLSEMTPGINNPKIKKSAMGVETLIKTHQSTPISELRRPLIALETTSDAIPLHDFTFPQECTLLLGNEECGLSSALLEEADMIVEIPLLGSKNSLNVGCAFAIVAAEIRRQTALVTKS